jgi:protein arginine kinase
MSSEESMLLLSHVRMGVTMGRFKDLDVPTINTLFLHTQPAHLQKIRHEQLNGEQRSIARAEFLRSRLRNHQSRNN